ncbi:hypothetical protein Tco_1569023 [Tanacetum coccineum]
MASSGSSDITKSPEGAEGWIFKGYPYLIINSFRSSGVMSKRWSDPDRLLYQNHFNGDKCFAPVVARTQGVEDIPETSNAMGKLLLLAQGVETITDGASNIGGLELAYPDSSGRCRNTLSPLMYSGGAEPSLLSKCKRLQVRWKKKGRVWMTPIELLEKGMLQKNFFIASNSNGIDWELYMEDGVPNIGSLTWFP